MIHLRISDYHVLVDFLPSNFSGWCHPVQVQQELLHNVRLYHPYILRLPLLLPPVYRLHSAVSEWLHIWLVSFPAILPTGVDDSIPWYFQCSHRILSTGQQTQVCIISQCMFCNIKHRCHLFHRILHKKLLKKILKTTWLRVTRTCYNHYSINSDASQIK